MLKNCPVLLMQPTGVFYNQINYFVAPLSAVFSSFFTGSSSLMGSSFSPRPSIPSNFLYTLSALSPAVRNHSAYLPQPSVQAFSPTTTMVCPVLANDNLPSCGLYWIYLLSKLCFKTDSIFVFLSATISLKKSG